MTDLAFTLSHTLFAAVSDGGQVLGAKLLNKDDFLVMLFKFGLNFGVTLTIVRALYYRTAKRPDYVFTYLMISTTVFLLCFLLESVKLELGFALGLFAIFGILRYRTDAIPIKEMTYLFVIIGIAVMNALANKKISHAELFFANLSIVALLALLERTWIPRNDSKMLVQYERVELIVPERRAELISDLRTRLGLDVQRIEVAQVSFLRDTADIIVYYRGIHHPEHQAVIAPGGPNT